ncbi:hypothetical protein EDB87DRAFT_1688279 [Lactarius vividus]|nr:hypothetical protein EDB87DRAFT_1688279 [Lactarius vividus]
MSLSDEVRRGGLQWPRSAPCLSTDPSKHGSPPDYYAPNVVVKNRQKNTSVAARRSPEEVYASTLPSWRAALWRQCFAVVEQESEIIARRLKFRVPDTYFLHTSMLGTHTFPVFLPAFFFSGHDDLGLCAFGVYMSSRLKDLVCSPQPYALVDVYHLEWNDTTGSFPTRFEQVVQLTVGNHDLEYGLPSTHPTNSTSMALFLGTHVYDLRLLLNYRFRNMGRGLVYICFFNHGQRLNTGMHGFMDCSVGIVLEIISWLLQHLVIPGVEKWVQNSDWSAPLVVTAVYLLLANQHPSPVDDCPYFEDAISFASVILCIITSFCAALDSPATIITRRADPAAAAVSLACLGYPVRLPHRRHYTPATEYVHVPPHTLRAVPSMFHLDLAIAEVNGVMFEETSEGDTGEDGEVNHYADVLTKVVVYINVGAIATVMVPVLFEALEWGV